MVTCFASRASSGNKNNKNFLLLSELIKILKFSLFSPNFLRKNYWIFHDQKNHICTSVYLRNFFYLFWQALRNFEDISWTISWWNLIAFCLSFQNKGSREPNIFSPFYIKIHAFWITKKLMFFTHPSIAKDSKAPIHWDCWCFSPTLALLKIEKPQYIEGFFLQKFMTLTPTKYFTYCNFLQVSILN